MRRAEPGDVERVDPGVDLVAGELLGRRVTSLDDAAHAAALVAHDPPETARLVHADRDEREGGLGLPARGDEVGDERGIEERHVTREHDELGGRRPAATRGRRGPRLRCRAARPGARTWLWSRTRRRTEAVIGDTTTIGGPSASERATSRT